MSLLSTLNTSNDVQEDTDTLGGSGPWPTDLYKLNVSMAYLIESTSGAIGVVLHMKNESGQELRETVYISSGTAKGKKTYYETQDGTRKNLPGYSLIRSLTRMTLDQEPLAVTTEAKIVNVYDFDAKKEVPKEVPVMVDLLGKEITAAVVHKISDKTAKNAQGAYAPTGEVREHNELTKFFHLPSGLTLTEAMGGETEGKFIHSWKEKNQGQVIDTSTKVAPGAPGNVTTGAFGQAPGAATATPAPTTSLFN